MLSSARPNKAILKGDVGKVQHNCFDSSRVGPSGQERGLAFAWTSNLQCFSVSLGTKAVVKTSSAQLSRQIPSDSEARISFRHAVW